MYQVWGGEGSGKKLTPPVTFSFCIFTPGDAQMRQRTMYFFRGPTPPPEIHYLQLGDIDD